VIVTRQRRKPFPIRRLILPAIAIALVVFAFVWPPSRNVIAAGPMAPVWRTAGNAFTVVAQPFHFAAQNQAITAANRQVAQLQAQLATAQSAGSDKDKQIAALQSQVAQLQTQAAAARSATPAGPRPAPSTLGGSSGNGGSQGPVAGRGDLSAGATADARRVAAYWGSMDPENAAKVVQRLPVPYVAHIFALMQPDSVGAILDALPPTFAAQITQENPELRR
jgi:flagellar motility protein MotE (MotC chaperone)